MTKSMLSLALGAACFAGPAFVGLTTAAHAGLVTYDTIGTQLCFGSQGCGVNSQTVNGQITVSFAPIVSSTVNADPTTFTSFGDLNVSCVGGGTACLSTDLTGLNLYINTTQSAPTSGSATISTGSITGAISGMGSSAVITWSSLSAAVIGAVTYSIANSPLALVPPSVNAGLTSIQGQISVAEVPIPAAGLLMIPALGAFAVAARKRKEPKRRMNAALRGA